MTITYEREKPAPPPVKEIVVRLSPEELDQLVRELGSGHNFAIYKPFYDARQKIRNGE